MIDETCPGCGLVAHAGGCFGGLHAETLREQKRAHGSECFDAGCPSEVEHCRGSGLPCAPRGLEEVVCRVCGRTFHQIEGMVAPMHTELPIPHLPCQSEHLWVLDPKHPLPDHFVCARPSCGLMVVLQLTGGATFVQVKP